MNKTLKSKKDKSMASEYIYGREIIDRWEIKELELLDHLKDGLKAYRKTGKVFDCPDKYNLQKKLYNINSWIDKIEHPDFPKNLGHWDEERIINYANQPPEALLNELKLKKPKIIRKIKAIKNANKIKKPCSWFYLELPESEIEAEKLIDEILNSLFLEKDVLKALGPSIIGEINKNITKVRKRGPRLRHSDDCRIKCREIAKKRWAECPDMTIEKMIFDPEIYKNSIRRNGKYFMENTVRGWIKDLCPNRKAGRRPKKR